MYRGDPDFPKSQSFEAPILQTKSPCLSRTVILTPNLIFQINSCFAWRFENLGCHSTYRCIVPHPTPQNEMLVHCSMQAPSSVRVCLETEMSFQQMQHKDNN